MHNYYFRRPCGIGLPALVSAWMLLSGCTSPPAEFVLNEVEIRVQERVTNEEFSPEVRRQLAESLYAMFGTPDAPDNPWRDTGPHVSLLDELGLDLRKLELAAGPVGMDEQGNVTGLYRMHCAHCHGISGDGKGPTATFLDPYPRDYRQGVYKFKSTTQPAKPTRADLKRVLVEGIPGTSMPSFKLLRDNELEALIEYVIYLSVRGETEIKLIRYVAEEGEFPTDPGILVGSVTTGTEDMNYANILAGTVYEWQTAERHVVQPVAPSPPASAEEMQQSIARGREIFYSEARGGCVQCHGNLSLGDGQTSDFDYWNSWEPLSPSEAVAAGALPQRNILPRNLRQGVFRGGRRPIDLYRKIYVGINGTPMPAISLAGEPGAESGVQPEEIWDLVNYLLAMPYEALSLPPEPAPAAVRERL